MDYSKDDIFQLMRNIDPFSILIIGINGQLRRVYCPFPVEVIIPLEDFNVGDIVSVQAVKVTFQLKNVFIINERAYYMYFFRIIL